MLEPSIAALRWAVAAALLYSCAACHAEGADQETPTGSLFNVRDFGAVGDGSHNDTDAFARAIEALRGGEGQRVLTIPSGTYYLEPADGSNANLVVYGLKDVTLRGEPGAQLVFGAAKDGLAIMKCERVRVESLAADYQPLPFTQGTIVEASPKARSFVLQLDDGFPRADEPQISSDWVKNFVYLFKGRTTLQDNRFYDQNVERLQQLDDDRVRFWVNSRVEDRMVGKRAALVGRQRGAAIWLAHCTDCELRGLSVYSAPGLAYGLHCCSQTLVQECRVTQKPGSGRLMSSVADALHVKWGKIGPRVLGCHFEGMGDDSVNIGGTYQPILAQPDARTLHVTQHGSLYGEKTLYLVNNQSGAVTPLPECKSGGGAKTNGVNAMVFRFDQDLPPVVTAEQAGAPKRADMIFNYEQVARAPVLRNNFFGRHRGRGVLMQAPLATIEGNRFERLRGGIQVGHHYGGILEGPNGTRCRILNNTFEHIHGCSIDIADHGPSRDGETPCRSIKNISIIGNQIDNYGAPVANRVRTYGAAIAIDTAENVLVQDNKIGKRHPKAPKDQLAIVVKEVDNAVVRNNTVSPAARD